MKVSYVSMVFPTATETFACTDIRAVRALGASVSVHTLRGPRPRGRSEPFRPFAARQRTRAALRLLAERGLGDLSVSHSSLAAICRGLWVAGRSPSIFLHAVSWVLRRSWRSPRHLLKSLALLPRSLDILASIRAERPDVVHLFWGHYPAIVGHLVRQHLPDIVVSMFLGAYDLERRYAGSASLARAADVVWTHARSNLKRLAELGLSNLHVHMVHRGIDLAGIAPAGRERVPQRIITVGQLRSDKGMADVLAVFARVVASWPDASLVMLGDGPERVRLISLADQLKVRRQVTFRGHVSHEEVRAEMTTAEVFILMSRSASERLPNAAKEAMSSRCACVVTDTPGIEELIANGTNGFVVAQGDVAGAARIVDALFRDRERAMVIGDRAHRYVVTHFDVSACMRRYVACWRRLVRARTGRRARLGVTVTPARTALDQREVLA